ncbi:hypothetical protein PMZ80_004138 [Knufia obscura]|uniref:DRBM domain-containing protein n=2 Tax=Knufia TaxID=430999 RepID=A0AAN8IIM7_9EURO|nr:hypothetical protein PMZ80_004138 [Knufia obscura]KAK5949267.1 hypothetical protein OHC33_009620 [Knufia fluminis]
MSFDLNMDFVPLGGSNLSVGNDGQDSQNSDQEDTASVAQRDENFAESDYWFGSIYFRCVLAQEVFDRATAGCSMVAIDSLLEAQMDCFPYQRAMQAFGEHRLFNLEANTYVRQGQYRTALMTLIGSTVRSNASDWKRKLLQLIRAHIGIGHNLQVPAGRTAVKSKTSEAGDMTERMPLAIPVQEPDLWKYTSILKEKGDVAGFVPQYNFRNVSQTPPLFTAVVSFEDYVFEGSGRTKQLAKHQASKEACKSLGLQIS